MTLPLLDNSVMPPPGLHTTTSLRRRPALAVHSQPDSNEAQRSCALPTAYPALHYRTACLLPCDAGWVHLCCFHTRPGSAMKRRRVRDSEPPRPPWRPWAASSGSLTTSPHPLPQPPPGSKLPVPITSPPLLNALHPILPVFHSFLADADAARLLRTSRTAAMTLLPGYAFTNHIFPRVCTPPWRATGRSVHAGACLNRRPRRCPTRRRSRRGS